MLLDTHIFLWAIKYSLGKLKTSGPIMDIVTRELRANGISWLPIDLAHCRLVCELPFHHRDPFDRLLVAQSLCEGHQLISADSHLDAYGIKRIW